MKIEITFASSSRAACFVTGHLRKSALLFSRIAGGC